MRLGSSSMRSQLLVRYPSQLLASSTHRSVHAPMSYMQSKDDPGGRNFCHATAREADIGNRVVGVFVESCMTLNFES